MLTVLMSMTGAKVFAYDIAVANSDNVTIYYEWTNNNKELAVCYHDSSNEYTGNVVIPGSVEYAGKNYPVTSISKSAFQNCSSLISVTISNGVTSIGEDAFKKCTSLTSVTIPNSVTTIGEEAFRRCESLTSITIPNSVNSIGKGAFSHCNGLLFVTIGKSVKSIGELAFAWCDGLSFVIIPNSVTFIDEHAFYYCKGLKTIVSEIEKPFETSIFADNSITLIVPVGTKATYQSTAGWNSFTNIVEVSEEAFVGYRFEVDGIYYTIDENYTVELTSKNKAISDAFVIPNQVELNGKKYDVTSIGEGVFSGCSELTSVTIPNSITSIGSNAFENCSGLASVTIPNSITSIGSNAFENCSRLTSVAIPSSVTSIGICAFSGCSGLKSVTIPNSVTSIGDGAFKNCSGLTSVTIPNSVESIGGSAFEGCRALTSVSIPNSVTSISNNTFSGCRNLTSVTIPNSITSIGSSAFSGCSGLKSVTIPNSVTSIGYYTFSGCSAITSVTIPNSVESIGESAFASCSALTSIIIGSGILSIGSDAFYNTNIKKTIWLANTPPLDYSYLSGAINYVSNDQFNIPNKVVYKFLSSYFDVDGIRYVPVSPSDHTCDAIDCIYDDSAENINIGETVTNKDVTLTVKKINPYTCYGNKHIKDIKLSLNGEIGDYAFFGCSNLKSIVIPDAITSLGSYAFSGCNALTSAKIGNGLETISEGVFSGCSSLSAITIPQAVTTIGNYVFYNCTSLTKFTIADSERTLTIGSNGSSPIFSSCPLDYVYIGRDISYQTGSNYGYSPFYRNTSLRAVKITDKETEISENEFYGCTNLQQVEIGDGVTTIGNWAFSGCSSLKYFAFGTQVATIGQEAFSDCTAIEEIISKAQVAPYCGSQALDDINKWECKLYVPKGCMAVYEAADQWKDFFFKEEGKDTPPQEDDNSDGDLIYTIKDDGSLEVTGVKIGTTMVEIPSTFTIDGKEYQVTSIGEAAFHQNSTIESVVLPNSITSIGEIAFGACFNLKSINIPNSVTEIGDGTFYGCESLTSINIPDGIKRIGESMFWGCTNLTDVTIPNSVTTICEEAFRECPALSSITIPASVTEIGRCAFQNCKNMKVVNCYAESVPNTDDTVFDGTPTEVSTLYVPDNAVEAYKSTWPWSDFKEIFPLNDNPDGIIGIKQSGDVKTIYSIKGEKLLSPAQGINIIKMKDATIKKVFVK